MMILGTLLLAGALSSGIPLASKPRPGLPTITLDSPEFGFDGQEIEIRATLSQCLCGHFARWRAMDDEGNELIDGVVFTSAPECPNQEECVARLRANQDVNVQVSFDIDDDQDCFAPPGWRRNIRRALRSALRVLRGK